MSRLSEGINRNIILLAVASLVTDVSSEMIQPLLPLFIVSLGGAGIAVGLVSGLGSTFTNLFQVVFGYISDRIRKRKVFVVAGYILSAVMKLIYPLAATWHHIMILYPMERCGKGIRTAPRDALLSSYSHKDRRGMTFGLHRTFDTAGAVIGSVLALVLFTIMGMSLRSILLLAGVVAFFSLIPIFKVEECVPKSRTEIRLSSLSRPLMLFIFISALFSFANISYMFYLLKVKLHGQSEFIAILMYVWFNIVYTLLSLPSGIVSDRRGRSIVLITGYFFLSVTALGFAFARSLPQFFLLFGMYGIVDALINPNQKAFVSDLSDESVRGSALGAFQTVNGLVALPAGILAGYLWDRWTSAPFIFASALSFSAGILFIILRSRMEKELRVLS